MRGRRPCLRAKFVGQPANLLDLRVLAKFGLINTGHGTDDSFVAVKDFFKREGNLPQGGADARGVNGQRQQVAFAGFGGAGEGVKRGLDFGVVAVGLEFLQALDLGLAHGGVVHFPKVQLLGFFQAEQIDADDGFLARINAGLAAGGGFFDAQFGQAGFVGLGHAAQGLDFLDVRPGAPHQGLGQGLDIIGAAPGINDFADAGFLLEEKLGVAGDARRKIGRQAQWLRQANWCAATGFGRRRRPSLRRKCG